MHAIIASKSRKACEIDNIHAEMLKADLSTSTRVLTNLFHHIWDRDTIPEDWSKGLIVKLPKKGNPQVCDNWRGITLLSIPSKVFWQVFLCGIDLAIDIKLRQEQASFRKRRGRKDQIFALRNINEQCLEWNSPLYINFIDFKKAFDSLHRDTLWKILRSYGVPPKMVTLIDWVVLSTLWMLECHTWWETLGVVSGVRQGCILSPILYHSR